MIPRRSGAGTRRCGWPRRARAGGLRRRADKPANPKDRRRGGMLVFITLVVLGHLSSFRQVPAVVSGGDCTVRDAHAIQPPAAAAPALGGGRRAGGAGPGGAPRAGDVRCRWGRCSPRWAWRRRATWPSGVGPAGAGHPAVDALGGVMALDVVLLTALLDLAAAPSTLQLLYLVHIALAAVVLRAGGPGRWGAVARASGRSSLAPWLHAGRETAPRAAPHPHADPPGRHVGGLRVAAGFIVYFVQRSRGRWPSARRAGGRSRGDGAQREAGGPGHAGGGRRARAGHAARPPSRSVRQELSGSRQARAGRARGRAADPGAGRALPRHPRADGGGRGAAAGEAFVAVRLVGALLARRSTGCESPSA